MYAHDVYKTVKDEITAKRNKAIAEAEARNNEVRELSPKIAKIDEELSGTGYAIFKAACSGRDVEPIKRRNIELQSMRRAELAALGFPEDYTEPKFSCALCSDTGSVDLKLCECFKKRLVLENIKNSGMGKLIEEQSFENFDLEWYRKSGDEVYRRMCEYYKRAKRYAQSFGEGGGRVGNAMLIGNTGLGKTHLTTAVAKTVIEKGYNVLYDSAQNIVFDFEGERFKSGYGAGESATDRYFECDLLIIDDLGSEFVSQYSVSCLYNLINTRCNRGLPTMVSTNLTLDELTKKYHGRITSRLLSKDSELWVFDGKDHRVYG